MHDQKDLRPKRKLAYLEGTSVLVCLLLYAVALLTGPHGMLAQPISQELIKAQIENQRAQAVYYRLQTAPAKDGWWQSSLMGTVLGATIALVGVLITGWRQAKLEENKWRRSRKDERQKETRLAAAELTRGLAAGIHAVAWCSWKARYEPDDLKEKDFAAYDREIKGLFPTIVGARIVLAALNENMHQQMTPFVKELYSLDRELAEASVLFRRSRDEGLKAVEACYQHAHVYDKMLLEQVSRIVNVSSPESASPAGEHKPRSGPNPAVGADRRATSAPV